MDSAYHLYVPMYELYNRITSVERKLDMFVEVDLGGIISRE